MRVFSCDSNQQTAVVEKKEKKGSLMGKKVKTFSSNCPTSKSDELKAIQEEITLMNKAIKNGYLKRWEAPLNNFWMEWVG